MNRAPSYAALSSAMIRREPMGAPVLSPEPAEPALGAGWDWLAAIRFFAACYAAAFLFFLIMLS
jgi:hypothetical protein